MAIDAARAVLLETLAAGSFGLCVPRALLSFSGPSWSPRKDLVVSVKSGRER